MLILWKQNATYRELADITTENWNPRQSTTISQRTEFTAELLLDTKGGALTQSCSVD